ncbi:MAG: sugar transferase [Hungatella sp.]|nr:sugar transferase [Hungatella sp.]
MYAKYIKRVLDFLLSTIALIILSPIILLLTMIGSIAVKGNPFFTQDRPGLNEKVFKLIKFRTMTNEKDENGEFLPDDIRIIPYGRFLRKTSLDELPELINIWKGNMAIVGPRPLLIRYLPYYTDGEKKRHSVRPGLTGLAQISGRNVLAWDSRLALDVEYVEHITFLGDLKIILKTVVKVIKREDVVDAGSFEMQDLDKERKLLSCK